MTKGNYRKPFRKAREAIIKGNFAKVIRVVMQKPHILNTYNSHHKVTLLDEAKKHNNHRLTAWLEQHSGRARGRCFVPWAEECATDYQFTKTTPVK